MKILIITSRFYPHVGGVENVVKSICDNLSSRHKIFVVTSLNLNDLVKSRVKAVNKLVRAVYKLVLGFKVSYDDKNTKKYSVKRFWINLPRTTFGIISFPYRIIASTVSLVNYVRRLNPDVINYHFPDDSSLYVWILSMVTKAPLVLNIHGNDLQVNSRRVPFSFFINRLVKRADTVIVNSDYMKKEFVRRFSEFGNKVVIIPNGIDVGYIQGIKPISYFGKPYAFFVGRMVHKKGVDVLIKAFARANVPRFKLLIEGSGEELEIMKRLAKDLGIMNRIKFTGGSLSDNEKVAYMKAAMFGAMPSRIEPFGIVALEMMAAGVPVVASRTGGLKKILENEKTCLFFKNEDVDDLSEKMKKMYSNRRLRERLSKNALKEVRKYENSKIARKYEMLLES